MTTATPQLTRDHMCLLASHVYSREADALYYGDRYDAVPCAADRAEAERLYQLAQEVAAEVTGARYRAAQHAAGEQQRKLDAVKAAEEAHDAACGALGKARRAADATLDALNAAKREAGL